MDGDLDGFITAYLPANAKGELKKQRGFLTAFAHQRKKDTICFPRGHVPWGKHPTPWKCASKESARGGPGICKDGSAVFTGSPLTHPGQKFIFLIPGEMNQGGGRGLPPGFCRFPRPFAQPETGAAGKSWHICRCRRRGAFGIILPGEFVTILTQPPCGGKKQN